MKKILALSASLTIAVSLCGCGSEGKSSSSKTEPATAAEKLSPADQLLEDVKGSYDELFTVICDSKYDQVWLDKCEAIVGKDMAESCAEMLKSACTGTVYGEETAFKVVDCTVNAEITGAVTPSAVAGRAENCVIESCDAKVTLDGAELTDQIGTTDKMYESADQSGEEAAENEAA